MNSTTNKNESNNTNHSTFKTHHEKRFQSNLKVNPLIDLNYKIDRLKSSLYPVELKVNTTEFKEKEEKQEDEDYEMIKKDLEKTQSENVELKQLVLFFF